MKRGLAQDLEKPSLTVTSHLAKVSLNSRDPVLLVDSKKDLYRRFTPGEAAGIQSFPDDFKFEGSDADAYRQIGNAIPPVLMWHVCNALVSGFKKSGSGLKKDGGYILKKEKERDYGPNKKQGHLAGKKGISGLALQKDLFSEAL